MSYVTKAGYTIWSNGRCTLHLYGVADLAQDSF